MTAIWSVDTERFYNNALKVIQNNQLMAVVKNNAYHYGLEFAVNQFLVVVINTFSTTSLRYAIRIRQLVTNVNIFLLNDIYEYDKIRYNIINWTFQLISL